MTRIDGGYYPALCSPNIRDGNWCADVAHPDLTHWRSEADALYNIVPYGCYTATVIFFVDHQVHDNYPIGRCFADPPPQEDCDPGLDGSYDPRACVSPVIVDTGSDKKDRYKLDPKVRVAFDLDADGRVDMVGWTKRNSDVAFLALDRNGNGAIDDGSELFGNFTAEHAANGFAALRKLAGIEFGNIDSQHAGDLFAKLLLWHDRNQDGISQPGELSKASDVLEAVGLGYTTTTEADKAGNAFKWKGWARKYDHKGKRPIEQTLDAPTREFAIYDVNLAVR